MKLQDALNSQQTLSVLAMCDLSIKARYCIDKNQDELAKLSQDFQKRRYDFISSIEGVTLSENGQSFNIVGHETEVQEGVQKMLDEEVDIKLHSMDMSALDRILITPAAISKIIGRNIIDDLLASGIVTA